MLSSKDVSFCSLQEPESKAQDDVFEHDNQQARTFVSAADYSYVRRAG